MLRWSRLYQLLNRSRSRKDRRRQAVRTRPYLESLEDRIAPAGGLPYAAAGQPSQSYTMPYIDPAPATVALSNVTPVNLFTGPNAQSVTAIANVASSSGTVNEGTVTFELLQSGVVDNSVAPVAVNAVDGQAVLSSAHPLVIPGGTAAGTYTLQASYSDAANNFAAATPTTATLTLAQSTANVLLGSVGPILASSSSQSLNVSATVLNADATIDEGTVTFTLLDGNNVPVGAAVKANVADGTANASLTVPGDTSGGSYTLQASYTDKTNVFVAPSPATTTLTILTQTAAVSLGSVGPILASPSSQSLNMSALVLNPNLTVNEGQVMFALLNGNNAMIGGLVQANVNNGTANASLTIPGGVPAGNYTIQASYLDPSGVFFAAPPTPVTVTMNLAPVSLSVGGIVAVTANSANQSVSVSATVASPNATIDQGTVTFVLLSGDNVPVSAAVTVNASNGTANASLTVLGGTPAGEYVVEAIYVDSQGVFAGSSGNRSLVVNSAPTPSPLQASLTIALDTAALLLPNDSAALALLTIVSERLLGQPLPSAADLLPTIEAGFHYTGEQGIAALEAGVSIAENLMSAAPQPGEPAA